MDSGSFLGTVVSTDPLSPAASSAMSSQLCLSFSKPTAAGRSGFPRKGDGPREWLHFSSVAGPGAAAALSHSPRAEQGGAAPGLERQLQPLENAAHLCRMTSNKQLRPVPKQTS